MSKPKKKWTRKRIERLAMEIAREAHMRGRIYNKRGESETPCEVERSLRLYVKSRIEEVRDDLESLAALRECADVLRLLERGTEWVQIGGNRSMVDTFTRHARAAKAALRKLEEARDAE